MSELRWILLGAGLALIAGIYLWGLRARRRSAAAEPARAVIFEQPPASERLEPARIEPLVEFEDDAPPVDDREFVQQVDGDDDSPPTRSQPAGRREPTLGQRLVAAQPEIQPQPMFADERERIPETDAPDPREDDTETAVVARAQRIVAIRVTAPSPSRFEGSLLQEALQPKASSSAATRSSIAWTRTAGPSSVSRACASRALSTRQRWQVPLTPASRFSRYCRVLCRPSRHSRSCSRSAAHLRDGSAGNLQDERGAAAQCAASGPAARGDDSPRSCAVRTRPAAEADTMAASVRCEARRRNPPADRAPQLPLLRPRRPRGLRRRVTTS